MARILHVISGLKVGGAEMVLHRLILSPINRQHVHVVAALDPVGEMAGRFRETGTPLLIFDFKRAPVREMLRLMATMRRLQPDIVQTWLYHADLIGGLAAWLCGWRRIIWGIRTTDVTKGGSRSLTAVRWLCARLSGWIPARIVCAAEAARKVHARIGYRVDRMVVIPNGFDIDAWMADPAEVAELRRVCGIAPDALVIGSLGRYSEAKDPLNFVEAAALVAARDPRLHFLMVGRDCDRHSASLMARLEHHQLANRFSLLGERRDVACCLAAMDVFVLHSRTEGFPNVLAEAMVMRRPCVTTDVGDAAQVIGDTGRVVPPENAVELATALMETARMSAQERAALGAAARMRVESRFSMDACARRFIDLYDEVLAGKPPTKAK